MTKILLTACLTLLGAFAAGYWWVRPDPASGTVVWSTGPTITHLESLGELVGTRVNVADVLVAEDEGYRGSWLIAGDALVAIDLGKAAIDEVNSDSKSATIRLPHPRVLSPRIDHERSRTWSVESTAWLPWKGNSDQMRDNAMKHAQKLVAHAAASDENLSTARTAAELIIGKVYRMVGWTVAVEWNPETPR